MPPSVKANRFNVSKLVYTVISKDDSTAFNHGPIKKFGEPMQVQLTPTIASGVLYGGGVKQEDMSMVTGYELQVEVNKVFPEVKADIYSHRYVDGVVTEKASDEPKDIAIGYEVDETGDNKEYVWFYKCKARPFGQTVQQKTDNINFSTDTITLGCMPRNFDGKIKDYGDTANPEFTKEAGAAFLVTVPGGTVVVA